MAMKISLEVRSNMVVARLTGSRPQVADVDQAMQEFAQMTELCNTKGINRILMIIELEGSFSFGSAFALISNSDTFGWQRDFRIALIDTDSDSDEANKFSEDTGLNRGMQMRFFKEEEAGKAWLLS